MVMVFVLTCCMRVAIMTAMFNLSPHHVKEHGSMGELFNKFITEV
jgi:hypothetical protein